MGSVQLQQPILDAGIYAVNYFNGRLLSGEDMGKEQDGNRSARARLGMSIGTGIVAGLNVTKTPPALPGEPDLGPSVTVAQGQGINSVGQTLLLSADTIVQLGSPSNDVSATPGLGTFGPSQSTPVGQFTLGEGIYLLTLSSTQAVDGSSPLNAFSGSSGSNTATCNTSFAVEAVKFGLIPLTIPSGLQKDADHLRNRIAYLCFGFTDASPSPLADSFSPLGRNTRFLETLQQNTAQNGRIDLTYDVPLAILDWSSDGSLNFIDVWSVRRRLIRSAYTDLWQDTICDQRLAEAEAIFLQFQSQLDDTLRGIALEGQTASQTGQATPTTPGTLSADQFCTFLPAAGYLPVGDGSLDWKAFLGTLAPPNITSVDRRFFRQILHNSFYESPIKVGNYGDNSPSNEPPVDVYQDPNQKDFVFYTRSNTGRVLLTVNAQGYQPASMYVSFTVGQQTQLTIPLTQAAQGQGQPSSQAAQPPISIDVDSITRPALRRVRFSIVQQPAKASDVPSQMITIDALPQNVLDWLNTWQTWFDALNPNQGIDSATPAIYMNDYYTAPRTGEMGNEDEDMPPRDADVPQQPWAYAVFGNFAVPLLVMLHYYTTPLPVPLARAGIEGLTDDIVQALAGIGISYIDQAAGAWTQLIANVAGQPDEFGRYLIEDALTAVEHLNTNRRYYEGMNDHVAEILEQMALSDDVSLANADQGELGDNLHSQGFASRLIAQARRAAPQEDWALDALGIPPTQIPSLKQIGVSSLGEFAQLAADGDGHKQLESVLQQDPQTIDQLQAKAIQLITAGSLAEVRIKDPVMLPNVNAEVATKLASSGINTVDEIHKASKDQLMQITGLSDEAVEDLKKEAKEAGKESLEVVKLAAVTKDVAKALDVLQIKTVSHLLEQGEERVAEALKATHGDRVVHYVSALFDGIRGAGR